ncbi:MAG TPA: hypothetical protein VER58_14715 [Thermoanaerobaculia bacterium]|nr:hypothetical protein [Thermoanaerobaculia bacterium]
MRKHQYRVSQIDPRTLHVRDSQGELLATVVPDRNDGAIVHTASSRFSMDRDAIMSHTTLSGIYEYDDRLQWKPLSLWHRVYGWTFSDGTVAVRFVPSVSGSTQYLVTVERPVKNELRLIAIGACLLQLTGTDFVAWTAIASSVHS